MASLQLLKNRTRRFIHNHVHFLQLHYLYFALIITIFSGLYYLQLGTKWAYMDALYMATTGCTSTGINTIPLSSMSTYQVIVLCFSSLFGSHIVISLVMVVVRKHYFTKRFQELCRHGGSTILLDSGMTLGNDAKWSQKKSYPELNQVGGKVIGPLMMPLENQHATHLEQLTCHQQQSTINDSMIDEKIDISINTGVIFADNIMQQREWARQQLDTLRQQDDDLEQSSMDNQGEQHSTDVLSLIKLTKEQRNSMGGAEYRALDLLTMVIPLYYIIILVFSSLAFRIYIATSPYAQDLLLTANGKNQDPINPWSMSFFITLSAFNNLGLSQIDSNMIPFQHSPFPLILCGFLVLAGNTAYPIFLRFTLWCMYLATPTSYPMHRETLCYLLDHPRRCYTTLFPARQTWWLLVILIFINTTQVVVYLATNFWLPVMDGIDLKSQMLNALFQAIATRNAGFSVVELGSLNPGTILVYIVAMYIGVYPVAISMRNSNEYQERSLGMYRTDYQDDGSTDGGGIILKLRSQLTINSMISTSRKLLQQPDFFVMTQIQRQLSKEICWLIIGIFCVCVMEARSIMSPSPVTIATVIYECVSAFGCVGSSLGGITPGTSQSADYQPISKLVIILLMYRGRHRALPAKIDRAVLLPSEQLDRSDTEEKQLHRLHRSLSCTPTATTGFHVYQRSETL